MQYCCILSRGKKTMSEVTIKIFFVETKEDDADFGSGFLWNMIRSMNYDKAVNIFFIRTHDILGKNIIMIIWLHNNNSNDWSDFFWLEKMKARKYACTEARTEASLTRCISLPASPYMDITYLREEKRCVVPVHPNIYFVLMYYLWIVPRGDSQYIIPEWSWDDDHHQTIYSLLRAMLLFSPKNISSLLEWERRYSWKSYACNLLWQEQQWENKILRGATNNLHVFS